MQKLSVMLAFKIVTPDSALSSKIIGAWTKSRAYHVELVIGDTWVSVYDTTGVKIQTLRQLKGTWEYKDLGTVNVTNEQYKIFNKFLTDQDGKKYDFKGITLSQILPLKMHSVDRWTCSELVTKLLQMLYFEDVLELDPISVTPGKLLDLYIEKEVKCQTL